MDRCLAKDSELGGIGCDNMTVIIVGFLNGRNEKDWYDWMATRYGKVGHEYEESDNRQQKGDDSEYNDDDSDEGLEIPADTSTEDYVTDDTDLENQNELTIDDIPHRKDSSSSTSSTESGVSSRTNSNDSFSKISDKSEKKNDDAANSPIPNPPQSPFDAKSPNNNNTEIGFSVEPTTINKPDEIVNLDSKEGKKANYNTWPHAKKDK